MATILAIDDERLNLEMLMDLLGQDYEVLFASSGEKGIDLALSHMPDLILLDIMMPEISGYNVFKRLQDDPRTADIPVIFVTAMSQNEYEIVCLELGAVDYVTKPFNPNILKLRVQNFLKLKELQDFYRNLSTIDGLTGLSNRRRFDEYLDQEIRRGRRQQNGAISLILMDVDHFKKYNDCYGHLEGDECLKAVASVLKESLERPADLAARYGGEEFVCILSETKPSGAQSIAEKLRKEIENLRIPHQTSPVSDYVTISLGCVTVSLKNEVTPNFLLEKADQLLYQAKGKGRNRVISKFFPPTE
ncbi:MAG: diguanylate cyclase [Gammaproteobacteria bacterium]|nr:diguanylate cyclase [Gammaproteobacteria bacterium]